MNEAKFYNLSLEERRRRLQEQAGLTQEEADVFSGQGGLTPQQADQMVENAVGIYALPLGVAQNFLINGREVPVPMVIEEPSVIAGGVFYGQTGALQRRFFCPYHRTRDDRPASGAGCGRFTLRAPAPAGEKRKCS